MARVRGYTELQKREYDIKKQEQVILKGLHAYKSYERKTLEDLSREFGISGSSLSKLLRGQPIRMTACQWLRMVHIAGMEVKKREGAEDT